MAALLTRVKSKLFIVAHRRTIQRDLVDLAHLFPIAVNERSKPYTWRWKDGAVPPFLVLAPA